MKKGPSTKGLLVLSLSDRTSCVRLYEGWPEVTDYRLKHGQVGILLADLEVNHSSLAKYQILWGDTIGFNPIEDLLFLDHNGQKYRLQQHLKNRPSRVICNTVARF